MFSMKGKDFPLHIISLKCVIFTAVIDIYSICVFMHYACMCNYAVVNSLISWCKSFFDRNARLMIGLSG